MFAEEQAWIGFYKRIGDAAVATELIQYLESDPDLKRAHPALYLRAKESVRRHKQRGARAKRVGAFVRMLTGATICGPVMLARKLFRAGGNVAIECLPESATPNAPATRHAKHLANKAEYARARAEFKGRTASTALPTAEARPEASSRLPDAT